MTEIEEMTEDMIEIEGTIEATTGTVVTIGAPTEIVATTETEGTIAATTEIGGMGIVATREGMIEATIAGMIAAVSATAETSMTEEVMTGERIGEVQKRRRLIGMGRRREAPRRLLLRRA